MIDLLNAIHTEMRSLHDASHYEKAPRDTRGLYAVWKLPNSSALEAREDFFLVIDIWDTDGGAVSPLEQLTQDIKDHFDQKNIYASRVQVMFYFLNRLVIPDSDDVIKRRQLRFQAQVYFMEG